MYNGKITKNIRNIRKRDQNLVGLDRILDQVCFAKLPSFGFVLAEKESIIMINLHFQNNINRTAAHGCISNLKSIMIYKIIEKRNSSGTFNRYCIIALNCYNIIRKKKKRQSLEHEQ